MGQDLSPPFFLQWEKAIMWELKVYSTSMRKLVRRFESSYGACLKRNPLSKSGVVTYIHQGVFAHGGAGREAVGVNQLGDGVTAKVPALHR